MAEAVAKGVSEENVNVKLLDVNDTDSQFIRDAIEKADGIIVGSPTIVGDVPRPVWDALTLLSTVKSRIKLGSAFGSYGWSGEATKMVEDRLSGLHIKLHKPSLRIKLIPEDKTLKECREFGKAFVIALEQKYRSLQFNALPADFLDCSSRRLPLQICDTVGWVRRSGPNTNINFQ